MRQNTWLRGRGWILNIKNTLFLKHFWAWQVKRIHFHHMTSPWTPLLHYFFKPFPRFSDWTFSYLRLREPFSEIWNQYNTKLQFAKKLFFLNLILHLRNFSWDCIMKWLIQLKPDSRLGLQISRLKLLPLKRYTSLHPLLLLLLRLLTLLPSSWHRLNPKNRRRHYGDSPNSTKQTTFIQVGKNAKKKLLEDNAINVKYWVKHYQYKAMHEWQLFLVPWHAF